MSDAQVEAKRLESWIGAYLVLRAAHEPAPVPAEFICRLVVRFGAEAAYIAANLKPSRNHRTFQLFAMFSTGVLFPELMASPALLDTAHDKLVANLLDDFTHDGVHVERSTHYHNITLETALGFVELARSNDIPVTAELDDRLQRALDFSAHAILPDGEIALIGDSDTLDHSRMFEAGYRLFRDPGLLWAATRGAAGVAPPLPSREFSGYFVLTDGGQASRNGFDARQHVFFDCAALGEGSHSHYDLFSVCWSAGGRQVVVDPGRYTYHAEPDEAGIDWRHVFKSTRSHNTVEIDGRDQTRYYSKAARPASGHVRYDRSQHRIKHGPEPELRRRSSSLGHETDWIMATAASSEYRPLHTRALVFMKRQYVVLLDHVAIDDAETHALASRLHLAADWLGKVAIARDPGGMRARATGWTIALSEPTATASTLLVDGWVSKAYGIKQKAPVLEMRIDAMQSRHLGAVLVPDVTDGRNLDLRAVSWLTPSRGQPPVLAVDIGIDDTICRDLFILAPDGNGRLATSGLEYVGTFAACRVVDGLVRHAVGTGSPSRVIEGVGLAGAETTFEWSRR